MYVRNIPFEMDFDGQTVKATMKPLSFYDALNIQRINDNGAGDDTSKAIDMAQEFAPKLREYVTEFGGFKDSEGSDVTLEEVCRVAFFAPLVVAMINKLATAAAPPQKPAESLGS